MSNESQSPPLRLKPRLRTEESTSASTTAAAAAAPEKTTAQATPPALPGAAPFPTPPPEPPKAPTMEDPSKLKLQPRTTAGVASPLPGKPALPAAAAGAPAFGKPTLPVRATAPAAKPSGNTNAPFGRPARPPATPRPARAERSSSTRTAGIGAFVIAALIAVGGVGYFAKNFLTKPDPAVPAAVTPAAPKPVAKPAETPALPPGSLVVDNPASTAGKLVAKVQDTVQARNDSEQVRGVDDVTAPAHAPGVPSPVGFFQTQEERAAAKAAAELQAAGGELPPVEPSTAFRTFVVHMKVNGVFQGDAPRAMLNGKMVKPGDLLDADLGVIFTGLNINKKQLLFKDTSGATMSRRY